MNIIRSSKCSIKFATEKKKKELHSVLQEYGKVVNIFINYFWDKKLDKRDLLKPIVDVPETWLSARLRKVAAREALDMISSVKEVFERNKQQIQNRIDQLEKKIKKAHSFTRKERRKINNWHKELKSKKMKLSMVQCHKPKHQGKRMSVSCTIAELQKPDDASSFNAWLHLQSIGNKVNIDIPIRFHKQFNEINRIGQRLNSYIITENHIQFSFEIETGPKKEVHHMVGIDTGINALASTSDKKQFGIDIKDFVNRSKRCQKGSKGKQKAVRALRQRIDEVAKEVLKDTDLVVVEKLSNLNESSKLKGRLSKNMRSSIGSWNYAYWLMRLQEQTERNRVSFRTVVAYNTSRHCPACGHTDRMNRVGEMFLCQKCGFSGNADIVAAGNILDRFVTGKYGSCCKPENKAVLACPELSSS